MKNTINISDIKVSDRMRQANPAQTQELSKSIEVVGLLHPIVLDKDNNLVSGLNRLEACKKLGMTEIPFTRLLTENELHLQLAEIDENLVRANLTQLEEAEQIAIRKEIYEKLYPESTKTAKDKAKIEKVNKSKTALEANSCPNDNLSSGAKPYKTFVKDTALKSGMSERTVQRKASLGAIISVLHKKTKDELINLQKIDAGLKFNPEELKVISVATPGKQKAIADAMKSGKSFAEASGIKTSKRALSKRTSNAPRIEKTKYLTAQGYFAPGTFKYHLFRVDYLESGAITITIAAEDATYFDMWLQNNHATLHSKPVDIFKN